MANPQKKTAARGYGGAHAKKRAEAKKLVDAGLANCWRCGTWLPPGQPFDLGHDDHDRSIYRGPECVPCNRATSGRKPGVVRRRGPGAGPRTRACEICGAEYKAGWAGQRTCSRACGVELRRRNAPLSVKVTEPKTLRCVECDAEFDRNGTRRITCGAACAEARNQRRMREHYHANPEYQAATKERSRQQRRWNL